jgi:hypothetical protein
LLLTKRIEIEESPKVIFLFQRSNAAKWGKKVEISIPAKCFGVIVANQIAKQAQQ